MLWQEQNKHMQFALRLRKKTHHLFLLVPGVSRVQSQVLTELLTACWCKHALLTQETRWTVVFWGKGLKKLLIFSFCKASTMIPSLKKQQWCVCVGGLLSYRGRFWILDHDTGKKKQGTDATLQSRLSGSDWERRTEKRALWKRGRRGCRCVNMFMTWECLSINRQAGQQQERQKLFPLQRNPPCCSCTYNSCITWNGTKFHSVRVLFEPSPFQSFSK